MKPEYIEFIGKRAKGSKINNTRVYQEKPLPSWRSYGVKYSDEFMKIDCDDYNKEDGSLRDPIKGKERSEAIRSLLDALQIKYNGIHTEHGKHFFFRKPKSWEANTKQNWRSAINVVLEYKYPEKDDHIPLMIDGVARSFFKGSIDNEDVDELPYFLYWIQKSADKPFKMDFPAGNRTQHLGGYLFYLVERKSFTPAQAFDVVRLMNEYIFDVPIPESDLTSQILNDSTFEKLEAAAAGAKSDQEKIPVTPETFRDFVSESGIIIRYNELLNIVEYENLPAEYQTVNDVQNNLPVKIQYDFKTYTGARGIYKPQVLDLISLLADENAYNPVKEYLTSTVWDGADRFPAIYNILGVYNELDKTLIRKWFYQTAAMPFNTMDAPFQPEGVLILQGKEGIGKTRFFAQLVPVPIWFSSLDKELTTNNKDILIEMLGAWIAEIGEIDRTFKANKSDIKNFITKPSDTIRKPYAREHITKARTTSFCGTTNKAEFLNTDTGFRRWWVIRVNQRIDFGNFITPDNLSQLWAQCYTAFDKNPLCFRLGEDEIELLETANKSVTEMLPSEEELRARLDFDAPKSLWGWKSPAELANSHLYAYGVTKYTPKQIGEALTAIMQDVPEIQKKRTGRGFAYYIPPARIDPINRYRSADK